MLESFEGGDLRLGGWGVGGWDSDRRRLQSEGQCSPYYDVARHALTKYNTKYNTRNGTIAFEKIILQL